MRTAYPLLGLFHVLSATGTEVTSIAPLLSAFSHGSIIPDQYIVSLDRNHAIEDHLALVGLDPYGDSDFKHLRNLNMYRINTRNHSLLNDYIRRDPRVQGVQMNRRCTGVERGSQHLRSLSSPKGLFRRWRVLKTKYPWNLMMLATWGKHVTETNHNEMVCIKHLDDLCGSTDHA